MYFAAVPSLRPGNCGVKQCIYENMAFSLHQSYTAILSMVAMLMGSAQCRTYLKKVIVQSSLVLVARYTTLFEACLWQFLAALCPCTYETAFSQGLVTKGGFLSEWLTSSFCGPHFSIGFRGTVFRYIHETPSSAVPRLLCICVAAMLICLHSNAEAAGRAFLGSAPVNKAVDIGATELIRTAEAILVNGEGLLCILVERYAKFLGIGGAVQHLTSSMRRHGGVLFARPIEHTVSLSVYAPNGGWVGLYPEGATPGAWFDFAQDFEYVDAGVSHITLESMPGPFFIVLFSEEYEEVGRRLRFG